MMNLYIHVPFCIRKCNYCAFYSTCPAVIDWENYTGQVLEQLDYFLRIPNSEFRITTIFFGGGTPSLMPVKYAERIVGKLRFAADAEFSIEANPKTLGPAELKDWKDLGLNRLSIGMQSFNDDELRFLGRVHNVEDSLNLLHAANDLDIRVNGDFIYGLPTQKVSDVAALCERINDTGLKSASLYELTLERGTKFQNMAPIPEGLSSEMYMAIQRALKLPRHEVSNYGEPCAHNKNVWGGEQYIGVGESAAGRIVKKGVWIETKIKGGRIIENILTDHDRAVEIAMTGLRTIWGVSRDVANDVVDWEFVEQNQNWFIRTAETLRMSDSGLLLLDGLMKDIIR